MHKFKPQVRSRHGSHKNLKKKGVLPLFPKKSVIRFGSTTTFSDSVTNGGNRVEINTVNAVKTSADKIAMKKAFSNSNVKSAKWWLFDDGVFLENGDTSKAVTIEELTFPIISKHKFGSRGSGNIKHDNLEAFNQWLDGKINLNATDNYIFERYYNYAREYRLHVTKDGCFYTCRKMLKNDTPINKKWFRNDSNSVWILETNDLFDKPVNWDDIVNESVKSLNAVGLDIGAVDVKIQSATNKDGEQRSNPKFIIIEINSAPSFGNITEEKYKEKLTELLTNLTVNENA